MISYLVKRNKLLSKLAGLYKSVRKKEMKIQDLEKEKEQIDNNILTDEAPNYYVSLEKLCGMMENAKLKVVTSDDDELSSVRLFEFIMKQKCASHITELQKEKNYNWRKNTIDGFICSSDSHLHLCSNSKVCSLGKPACDGQNISFITVKK